MGYLLRKVNSVTICLKMYAYLESHKCYFSFEYNFFFEGFEFRSEKRFIYKKR